MTKTNNLPLFENIEKVRKSKNLKRTELARLSGLNIQTIEGIRKRGTAVTSTLEKLAKGLNISIDNLINGITSDEPRPTLIEVPIWKLEEFKVSAPKTRYQSEEHGKNTFGLVLNPADSGFPKGTVIYFNPDLTPKSGDTVLIKVGNNYLVKKYYREGEKAIFAHLKFEDIVETYKEYEILGVYCLMTVDPFFSLFD